MKDLKSQSDSETQREEFRKKYEQYKKLFMNEKLEKECKIKELTLLKEKEGPIEDATQIKIKYENLKQANQKEYNTRKEKEQKLEAANSEIQKQKQSLDDLYTQIDELFEASAASEQ